MSDLVRVAVDAVGGDYAPVEPVKGAVEAVNADERVKVQLVGQVDVIEKELQKYTYPKERVEIVPATEIIERTKSGFSDNRKYAIISICLYSIMDMVI